MAELALPPYVFRRSERSIFAEIYFPKKLVYQSEIYTALEQGLNERRVRHYLSRNVNSLILEFRDYPLLFDPRQYDQIRRSRRPRISRVEARRRIRMYHSHFQGWSMYDVSGVFLNRATGAVDDELTQVIRVMFRLESTFQESARVADCQDVLEAIITWGMEVSGTIDDKIPRGVREKAKFVAFHHPWPRRKRAFVEDYFEPIAKEVRKWIDDTALFVFGYLIRRFWTEAVRRGRREDQIWVASFFNLGINIVQRLQETPS